MARPDAELHNPDPAYLRELIRQTGLSNTAVAERLGVTRRMLLHYLTPGGKYPAPYKVQYMLEQLAAPAVTPRRP